MAENVQLMTFNARYFCYICNREVSLFQTTELICPSCSGGFLEEVSEDNSREEMDDEDLSDSENDGLSLFNLPMPRIRGVLNDMNLLETESETDEADDSERLPEEDLSDSNDVMLPIRNIIRNLGMENLRQVRDFHSVFHIFLEEDLDAISTMLLNEPDVSGPPPLPKEQIKLLPTITVTKEMTDKKIQCTVCMEDFHIREKVKGLSCEHCFHDKCITPWLELHGTCPNCRKTVEIQEPKNERSRSWPRSETHSRNRNQRNYSERATSLSDFFTTSPFSFL